MGPGNSENDVIMDDGDKDGGDSVGGLNDQSFRESISCLIFLEMVTDNGDWLCANL